MSKSGEERLLMGMSMFETARKIMLASLPVNTSEEDKRKFLMKRLYGEKTEDRIRNTENRIR
jgi:hypothetical protein